MSQRMVTAVTTKPESIQFVLLLTPADFDTAFDADHEAHAQLLQGREQGVVGKSAIGRQPNATWFDILKDQFERAFDDCTFIAPFEHTLVVGAAPVDRNSTLADDP